jgi:hypothetical protein
MKRRAKYTREFAWNLRAPAPMSLAHSFFAAPGTEPGLLGMTDTRDCSCADRQRSRNVCKHMRAVRFWMAAYQTGAVAPKPRPTATAQDDRIGLTPDGAAYLAGLEADAELADDDATTVGHGSMIVSVRPTRGPRVAPSRPHQECSAVQPRGEHMTGCTGSSWR